MAAVQLDSSRRIRQALALFLIVTVVLLAGAGRSWAGETDSVDLAGAGSAARQPLIPGQANAIMLDVAVQLTSHDNASLRLVGTPEGGGAPASLGDAVTVQRGSARLVLTGSYQPVVDGPRWLTVQAVLTSSGGRLAQSATASFVIMNRTSGAHADVYWSPSLDPGLAQSYASDFDQIWTRVGAIFNSYNDARQVILLAADNPTFEQTLLSLGYSAADAAARRSAAEAGQISALNHAGVIIVNLTETGLQPEPLTLAHEYSETRFLALQPGNQGAGWLWDGLADTIAARLAPRLGDAGCAADSRAINDWRTAMLAIGDGSYVPLAQITTQGQWIANYADDARQYAEGYTAVQFWQEQFGFDSLVQFVEQPKAQPSDFEPALQQVLGMTQSQFEAEYLTAMHADLANPPLAIPLSVHLDPAGIRPDSFIYLTSTFGEGSGSTYRTPSGLAPGDYQFEFQSDGTVLSTDGKATLTSSPYSFKRSEQGLIYAGISDPAYQGRAGTSGREVLRISDLYGRAGLSEQYFFVVATSAAEMATGDCQQPWPDGNQITVALPAGADAGP